MSTHTPGPWTVSKLDGRTVGPIRMLFDTNSGTTVPQLQGVAVVKPRAGETKANARLIAAAPDLLQALEMLLRTSECACVGDTCDKDCTHEIARRVIAEAEDA